MTREKLLRYGKEYLCDLETACCKIGELHLNFVRESIKALEREQCEDAVSRQAVLDKKELVQLEDGQSFYCISPEDVETLPSVTPKPKYNTSEWCHDCSEYDHDKHCCPRYNKVIRKTVEEIKQPCEDTINRSEAIKYLNTNMAWYDEDGNIADSDEKLKAITDLINGVPPVYPKSKTGHWVLVSEGMPNEFADVICCTEAKEVFVATYLGKLNDGTDCFDDYDGMMWEGDIIAWMPLPEPFEPQKVRNKCHI